MSANGNGATDRPVRVRVKIAPRSPYGNRFSCSSCCAVFERGGTYIRLECDGFLVDFPLCLPCSEAGLVYEAMITFDRHNPSHRLGLA